MRQGAPPQQHERAARRASHTSDDPIAIFRLASGHATSQLRPEGKGEWKGRLRAGSECGGVQSKRLPIRKPGVRQLFTEATGQQYEEEENDSIDNTTA